MKHLFLLILILTACGGVAAHAHAQTSDLLVTPAVIDEKAKARDILKESITVKNTSNHVLQLYPSVKNINVQDGSQTFTTAGNSDDLSDSLANWIELTRGVVQLGPGEERSIPFIIRLNLNAVPNIYHAQISFTEGETRDIADAKAPLGVVTVNLELKADVKELLQLEKFSTGNVFFSGDDVLFDYKLQNIGNQELQPKGQIHVYDRKGKEVAAVDVNKNGKTVSPDQDAQLASVWTAAKGFGRYKAMLDVAYGSSQTASVQDTVFFWIIPWKQMLLLFTISLVCMVILALYFHRWLERRHLYKFAHAGLLNTDTLDRIQTMEIAEVHPLLPLPPADKKPRIKKEKVHTPEPEPTPTEHRSLKEVLHKEESRPSHGHSIDLKQMKAQSHAAHAHAHHVPAPTHHASNAQVHGHVISLKKKQE